MKNYTFLFLLVVSLAAGCLRGSDSAATRANPVFLCDVSDDGRYDCGLRKVAD